MSCYFVYVKDGVKHMRPIHSREEYLALRNGGEQPSLVKRIRAGEDRLKYNLVQMNYSCLPNADGTLKGSATMSTTVGMDIDHVSPEEMQPMSERILAKKDELGLLMLEMSARAAGYHLTFKRKPELSQEDNLKWASELLGVAYDKGAKDITRVFFTTTASEEDLIYLDDELFEIAEAAQKSENALQPTSPPESGGARGGLRSSFARLLPEGRKNTSISPHVQTTPAPPNSGGEEDTPAMGKIYPKDYHGIAFTEILQKYWELFNDGKEPVEGDRDTLTFQLASDLRHICGRNAEWLDQVIPCYDNFPEEEKRQKIRNALQSKYEGMPYRLKQVL